MGSRPDPRVCTHPMHPRVGRGTPIRKGGEWDRGHRKGEAVGEGESTGRSEGGFGWRIGWAARRGALSTDHARADRPRPVSPCIAAVPCPLASPPRVPWRRCRSPCIAAAARGRTRRRVRLRLTREATAPEGARAPLVHLLQHLLLCLSPLTFAMQLCAPRAAVDRSDGRRCCHRPRLSHVRCAERAPGRPELLHSPPTPDFVRWGVLAGCARACVDGTAALRCIHAR